VNARKIFVTRIARLTSPKTPPKKKKTNENKESIEPLPTECHKSGRE
jgi:hypothetical protein